jgi:hypothetical protein
MGISPDSLFHPALNSTRPFKFPISCGIDPYKLFEDKSKSSERVVMLNKTMGTMPTKLFFERSRVL